MSKTIYVGPSKLNGELIRGVITETTINTKLTDRLKAEVLQLWILPHDTHPIVAIADGTDESVCGQCPLRSFRNGEKVPRLCYVNPNPIGSVWRHSHDNPIISPTEAVRGSRARLLRLGAYGDPAALPFALVEELCRAAEAAGIRKRTGYTHQARVVDQRWRRLLMASCEGTQDALELQLLGWRTFTTVSPGTDLPPDTITCPAANEAGGKTTCEKCGLCDGVKAGGDIRKNIAINIHGSALTSKVNGFATLMQAKTAQHPLHEQENQ